MKFSLTVNNVTKQPFHWWKPGGVELSVLGESKDRVTEMFNRLLIKHWWKDASIREKQWPGVSIDNVMRSKCFPNSLVHLHN